MRKIPDLHRLNKTKTAEMSREELNKKLKEQTDRAKKKGFHNKPGSFEKRRQDRISAETRRQLPPQSPERRRREEERKKAEAALKKKRRRRGSNIIYYIIFLIIAVVTVSVLSTTVLFNTESIVIIGESEYTDAQIIAASELVGNENLIKLDLSPVPDRILEKLVKLDSVKAEKVFPTTIRITVEPSVPMASFLYAGQYYIISHSGRVMQIDSDTDGCMQIIGYRPAQSVKVGGFITAEDPKQDELIEQMNEAIERSGIGDITSLDITDSLGIELTYENRVYIKIGAPLDIDEKLTIAKTLLNEGYIGENEKVRLDITDRDHAVQRPVTDISAAIELTAVGAEETPEGEDTSGEGENVLDLEAPEQ